MRFRGIDIGIGIGFLIALAVWGTASDAHGPPSGPEAVALSARALIGKTLFYDSSYVRLDYPGGDVPLETGVCTDVVVRALRGAGLDLQGLIHEDMRRNFSAYPAKWGLKAPDRNIDHRRVPNIVTYFRRQGRALPLPVVSENVRVGDLIAWRLPDNAPHIGVVTRADGGTIRLVHNIGSGAQEQAVLFAWPITAHLRPLP